MKMVLANKKGAEKRKRNITRKSGGLCVETRNNGGFSFGNLLLPLAQGCFGGVKPVSKICYTRSLCFSFLASFFASFEFLFQFFGALFSKVQGS